MARRGAAAAAHAAAMSVQGRARPRERSAAASRDWSATRGALLAWYDANARDLPWRRTSDPYAIWVSEIMLQQTRVETVVPYYTRFLQRFPDTRRLAAASLDDVLSHWSGLGYYRRARLLHQGAQVVVRDHGGELPRDPALRRALPGIGPYTAGAIGSIAFDLPEPIVDGNVARVLARVLSIATALGERATERSLWAAADELARGERPGALNQALMELGARICTPVNARCDVCPIAASCAARAAGRVDELPIAAKKKAPKPVALVALVARASDGALWLTRSDGSLFGGLWGCPLVEGRGRAAAEGLARELALAGVLSRKKRGTVRHVLSHRALSVEVYELADAQAREHDVSSLPGASARVDLRKMADAELVTVGIATLTRKILSVAASGVSTS
jgi:A/G-specific adenine glycosylase